MSATDELRRLLDVQGIKWWEGWDKDLTIYDGAYGVRYVVDVTLGELFIRSMLPVTPAQAIEATLGRGKCQDLGGTGANDEQVFNCSECGCVLSLYDRDGSNNLCTSFIFDYPRYCPECGRKVVDE